MRQDVACRGALFGERRHPLLEAIVEAGVTRFHALFEKQCGREHLRQVSYVVRRIGARDDRVLDV